MSRVSEFKYSGSVEQIGQAQGEQLREEIDDAVDFYSGVLGVRLDKLENKLQPLLSATTANAPQSLAQIKSIALGANQSWLAIFALNARSELMNNVLVPECTSISYPREGIFAQNWDWAKRIAPLMSVQHVHTNDAMPYTTYTEPGMLTKLFINAEGLACQLNILKNSIHLTGLPIHLLLNKLASESCIQHARELIHESAVGKASHILLAQQSTVLSYEFTGVDVIERDVSSEAFVHTNHYLGESKDSEAFPTSHQRYEYVSKKIHSGQLDLDTLIDCEDDSPMRSYIASAEPQFGEVGTVATVAFDLMNFRIGVRRANVASPMWQWFSPINNN